MSVQDDFIQDVTGCIAPGFVFPPLTDPGLPNFALAMFLATMAPINVLLGFLPPNPAKLPSIPSISILLEPFLLNVKLPASYPGISFDILTIPGVGDPPYIRDVSGEIKLMAISILLPFKAISAIITKIISDLKVEIPGISTIFGIFVQLAIGIGITGAAIASLGLCMATAIFNLLTALIPV